MSEYSYPECKACDGNGNLLPLSDFGSQGAPIHYKAWVCSDPDCGFNIKIRNGDVYLNEPIASGENMHSAQGYGGENGVPAGYSQYGADSGNYLCV